MTPPSTGGLLNERRKARVTQVVTLSVAKKQDKTMTYVVLGSAALLFAAGVVLLRRRV